MTCLFFVGRLGGLSSGERKDLVLIVAAISPRWMGIVKGRFSIRMRMEYYRFTRSMVRDISR